MLDRVVSSYTPTLRALIHARAAKTGPLPPQQRLLLVAMPTTPGQPALSNVTRECRLLTGLFLGTQHALLAGAEATRQTVAAALDRHGWVHFSCHDDQDLASPAHGGVLLHDGRLTITDLTANPTRQGEFAFLSACKTATGGVSVLDEAITLAAALQYGGWRHVIATLWSVWDAAADVTEYAYTRLVDAGHLHPSALRRRSTTLSVNFVTLPPTVRVCGRCSCTPDSDLVSPWLQEMALP